MWLALAAAIKGFADTVLGFIKEYHLSPEEAAKLQQSIVQAQMDFQRQVWDLETQDRDSARKREATTGDPTTRRLAYVYTGGYFLVFLALITGVFTVPESQEKLVDVLLAVLTAGQYSILAYYFGSSHGSASKDATLDRVVNHKD